MARVAWAIRLILDLVLRRQRLHSFLLLRLRRILTLMSLRRLLATRIHTSAMSMITIILPTTGEWHLCGVCVGNADGY